MIEDRCRISTLFWKKEKVKGFSSCFLYYRRISMFWQSNWISNKFQWKWIVVLLLYILYC